MLHPALYEPEIPQNTGNMIRTCMAAGIRLCLIQPLGFSLDEQHLKRTGMDYMKELECTIYKSWEEFTQQNPSDNYYYVTGYGKKAPSQPDSTKCEGDIYFTLGKENTGIPKTALPRQLEHYMRPPMVVSACPLNLSNCAAVILYEALRQLDYPSFSGAETTKREDWLTT